MLHGISKIEQILESTEAINFQADSTFPKELEAIFQSILDFSKQHDEKFGKVTNNKEALIKHSKIKLLIENEIGDELIKCVKKHTSFEVDEIITSLPTHVNSILDIAILTFNTNKISADIFESIDRVHSFKTGNELSSDSINNLINLRTQLDKKHGRILSDVKIVVNIIVPVGLFVVDDIVDIKDVQFTAGEITALFLHEIGHIFGYIEYTADICYTGYYGNNILRDTLTQFESNPEATLPKVVKLAKENIGKCDNKIIDIVFIKSVALLEKIEKRLNNDDEINEADRHRYKYSLLLVIAGRLITMTILCIVAMFDSIFSIIIPLREMASNHHIDKYSTRDHFTAKNTQIFERLADEYVSRYKMSKELNSTLIKFDRIISELKKLGIEQIDYSKITQRNMACSLLFTVTNIPNNFMDYLYFIKFYGNNNYDLYESDEVRLKRNIKNLLDVLKDPKIDPKIRANIVKDVEEMEAAIKKHPIRNLNGFDKILKFILNLSDNAVRGVRWIFGSPKADEEYFKLFEHLDSMLSNKGFYYAAKFKDFFKG